MEVKNESFGKLKNGKEVNLFTIRNEDGSLAKFANFGATVVDLQVPNNKDINEHVVLGFDDLHKYEEIRAFYGATVGRFGNRIAGGKFTLDDVNYNLAKNEGDNHLHGGINGFDRVVWNYEILESDVPSVKFSYLSRDGDEGYPGNLNVAVTYSFTVNHELILNYCISTDKPTVKNVTNHSYINLSGNVKESITNHTIIINGNKFLPIDEKLIPIGEIISVEETPMNFLNHRRIGEKIDYEDKQLKHGLGYDHCWVLNKDKDELSFAAEVYDPQSGRVMKVFTTEPAIQFYSGNFMDGSHSGREGIPYDYRYALCLETQHYPDSPNHKNFPSTRISPESTYNSKTIYKFLVR